MSKNKKTDWQQLDKQMQALILEDKNARKKTQKSKGKIKINRDTNMGDLIEKYPYLADILIKDYELHCANCMLAGFDTLYEGSKLHGMSDQEIDDMIERLIKIVEYNK